MTQHEGMPAQLQGEQEDFGTLPRHTMECGKYHIPPNDVVEDATVQRKPPEVSSTLSLLRNLRHN